jgi:cytochrome c oxidase assembly factor CtaG
MKELLFSHPVLKTTSIGIFGTTLPMALLQWTAVASIWQSIAAVIAAVVLILTLINVILELMHRWRREKRERQG